jgi:hypothetical protein
MVEILIGLHGLWGLFEILRELPAFVRAYPEMAVVVLLLVLSGGVVAAAMRRVASQPPPSIR